MTGRPLTFRRDAEKLSVMSDLAEPFFAPPDPFGIPVICVCGSGGSGTRILGQILRRAGVFLGDNRNGAEDSLDLVDTIGLLARDGEAALTGAPGTELPPRALELWREALSRHLTGRPEGAVWGWKNPRSMFLLPLSLRLCPALRVIHVVRDGRDMALSTNQRQYRLHRPEGEDSPVARAQFWSDSNLAVASFAEGRLGPRYLRLRYEDVARDPAGCAAALFRSLDLPQFAAACADMPPGAPVPPRHTALPPDLAAAVQAAALPGLRTFGYV